jgi:subtilisin family serine protease
MTAGEATDPVEELRPAWSVAAGEEPVLPVARWPHEVTREWAWGGSAGEGARVCIVDSGIEPDHPAVVPVARRMTVEVDDTGLAHASEDTEVDVSGHGTACASIVRRVAPECELTSMRVMQRGKKGSRGSGMDLLAGLAWAVKEGFDVINLSLSTRRSKFAAILHDLADGAYFSRTMLVASAHNMPVESYPWRFAALVSVGSHEGVDPTEFFYNPDGPVEFFAPGVDVDVAWSDGSRIQATGNSFAAPHVAGMLALIRAKHPSLTPFELKSVLRLTASNRVSEGTDGGR